MNTMPPQNSGPPDSSQTKPSSKKRGIWRVGIWEPITTTMILGGLVMLMQPFSQFLFTYSFIVILAGTIGFAFATKLPE
jgi:hypothetical protein